MELTNCSPDAAIIALHDSNNDLEHAIAVLLDGETEVVTFVKNKLVNKYQFDQF